MVGVLARYQVSQEARTRQPLRNRPHHRRPRGPESPPAGSIAGPAGIGLTDVFDDEVAGRPIVELLADLFTDADAQPSATGARLVSLGYVVHDALARKVVGQRLAAVPGPGCCCAFVRLLARHPRRPRATPFGALAEVQPQRLVKSMPQLLVLLAQGLYLVQELPYPLLQRGHILRQEAFRSGRCCVHAPQCRSPTPARQLCGRPVGSSRLRLLVALEAADAFQINTIEDHLQLPRRQFEGIGSGSREVKTPLLQALVPEAQAIAVPVEHLEAVGLAVKE